MIPWNSTALAAFLAIAIGTIGEPERARASHPIRLAGGSEAGVPAIDPLWDLPLREDVRASDVNRLPPLEALFNILRIPEEAREMMRAPGPLPRRSDLPGSPVRPLRGRARAGIARVDLGPPPHLRGLPLSGTVRRLHPWPEPDLDPHHLARLLSASRGVRDPFGVKALSISVDGFRIVWASVDTVMVTEHLQSLVEEILQEKGRRPDLLLLSATHTHSGPGAIQDSRFLWLATDVYHPDVADHVARGIARAALEAMDRMVPARLVWQAVDLPDLVYNRRRAGGLRATVGDVLRVQSQEGACLGLVILFPIHATVWDDSNLHLSSDVAGAIERQVEAALPGAIAMMVQGAEGDQAPVILEGETPDQSLNRIGQRVAAAIVEDIPRPSHQDMIDLDLVAGRWTAPRPVLRPGLLVPAIPRWLTIPLDGLIPREAPVVALRLGTRVLVTVPGEPIFELGESFAQAGADLGLGAVRTIALTGGYLGYVTTPEEYTRGGYEAFSTFFGPRTSIGLEATVLSLLDRLARRDRNATPR